MKAVYSVIITAAEGNWPPVQQSTVWD